MHETRFKIKSKQPAAIFYSSISPTETSIWKCFFFFLNHVSCFVFRSFMGLYNWGFPLFLCPLSDPSITQLCFEPLNHGFRGLFNRLALICCLLLHLKKTNCPFSYFKLSYPCAAIVKKVVHSSDFLIILLTLWGHQAAVYPSLTSFCVHEPVFKNLWWSCAKP